MTSGEANLQVRLRNVYLLSDSATLSLIISPVHIILQALDFLENVKEKKFVLVHGEGFGAWCWYKTISLLEEVGLSPIAIDLKGSGIDLTDTNKVDTLVEYSKPLIEYLQGLPDNEKVLVKYQSYKAF